MRDHCLIGVGVALFHGALGYSLLSHEVARAPEASVRPMAAHFAVRQAATPAVPAPPRAPQPVPRLTPPSPQRSAATPAHRLPRAASDSPAHASPALINTAESVAPAPADGLPATLQPTATVGATGSQISAAPRTVSIREVQYLRAPSPIYPRAAERRGESGEVLLRVLIGTDGQPAQVIVTRSSGYEALDRAAIQAMKAAQFKPYLDNGVAQTVWVQTPIAFHLESSS